MCSYKVLDLLFYHAPQCCIFTELARDCLNRGGKFIVEGGFISPVHDAYGKKVNIPLFHTASY